MMNRKSCILLLLGLLPFGLCYGGWNEDIVGKSSSENYSDRESALHFYRDHSIECVAGESPEAVKRIFNGCHEEYTEEGCVEAIKKLESIIEDRPKCLEAHFYLASAYQNRSVMGQFSSDDDKLALQKKALIVLKKAVEVAPNNSEAHYRLGTWSKDPTEKLEHLRKAVDLASKNGDALEKLGHALLQQDNDREAFDTYMKHFDQGQHSDWHEHWRFARAMEKKKLYRYSAAVYQKTIELESNDFHGRKGACYHIKNLIDLNVYEKQEEMGEFVRQVKKLRLYCANHDHYDLAVQYEQEEQFIEAIKEASLQLKENPYYEDTYVLLERLYNLSGDTRKALGTLKKYFEVEKDHRFRCREYQRISWHLYRNLDPEFYATLKDECENPQKDEQVSGDTEEAEQRPAEEDNENSP